MENALAAQDNTDTVTNPPRTVVAPDRRMLELIDREVEVIG